MQLTASAETIEWSSSRRPGKHDVPLVYPVKPVHPQPKKGMLNIYNGQSLILLTILP
jgi:hypothetical protein